MKELEDSITNIEHENKELKKKPAELKLQKIRQQ